MPQIDLRQHQRILVPGSTSIRVTGNGKGAHVEGIVTVIGLGGMFIRTKQTHPFGTILHLSLSGAQITFDSECTVRNPAQNGVGVEFTNISPENEQKLKALLLQLKG